MWSFYRTIRAFVWGVVVIVFLLALVGGAWNTCTGGQGG